MPQAEERVQLLDQLGRGGAAAHGADADGVPGGRLARHFQDRKRDVQPAADVDVPVGVGLAAHVAGRLERLDQPVLEQQRAQLALGDRVVHVLGLLVQDAPEVKWDRARTLRFTDLPT